MGLENAFWLRLGAPSGSKGRKKSASFLIWPSRNIENSFVQRFPNPTYANYAYLVPFVEEDDYFFLKTVIPSRKATREYLNSGEADAKN